MLPFFLIFTVILLVVLIVGCILYIQFYKLRINKVLNGSTAKVIPPPFHVAIVLLIAFLIFMVFFSFVGGFGLAYRSLENKNDGQIDVNAFYAEIISINEDTITVNGITLNEKNYRGEFTFRLHESIVIEWNDQKMSLNDLQEGELISVVLIKDVGGIEDIFKIQRLKD